MEKNTNFVSSHQSSERFMPLGLPQRSALAGGLQAKSALRLAPFEGWSVLVLLGIALYCVVASIIAVGWVSNSSWLLLSPAVGLLIGLIVAKVPHFSQLISHLGACTVGCCLSVCLCALAFQISWIMVIADLRSVFSGQLSEVIFFFYLSFLCFFLGYFGSWLVYRAHLPWLVVLVYVSIMLVNLNSARQDMSYLLIIAMVAALLLLIARMQLATQVAKWKHEGLHTDRQWLKSMTWRCMQGAGIIVMITLILGWFLPGLNQNSDGKAFWNHLNTAWTDAMTGHFSLQDLNAFVTSADRANFFGDQLTISDTVHLPTGEVLRYQITNEQNTPYYLEGFTFDTFDGHTWTSSLDATRAIPYRENDRLQTDTLMQDTREERIKVSITSPPNETKNYIFVPANPHLFSVPTVVYYDAVAGGIAQGTAGAWTQQKPLSVKETYEAAFVPSSPNALDFVPSFSGGKANQRAYDGLAAQYFQVPTNISSRVQAQALAWTHDSADVYTALKSLENHLSDTSVFAYSLNNRPVPDNTDVISWLLQTRRGYCTYYATAMTIMARIVGIPTRMVNGFSQGVYDAGSGQFVVNGSDAHSWVQAFFPSYGWINFDPTPGFAPNASPPPLPHNNPTPIPSPAPRPTVTAQATTPVLLANQQKNSPPPSARSGGNSMQWIVVSLIGLFLAIAFLLVAVVRHWWLNLYTSSPLISAMYWRFCRVASFFGMAPRTWQTPHEYGHMIGQRFPQHAHAFSRLTDLFVREHWGGPQQAMQGLNEAEVKDLAPSWPSLLANFLTHKFKRKPPT